MTRVRLYSMPMDAADFYTGLVCQAYSALRATHFSTGPYRAFIDEHGQPGLELGCGDDGPFFDLAAAGYAMTGVDSSADMVRRGLERLDEEGISAEIHHQKMEELNLESTFPSIYLAGPTFNLLPDDSTAQQALRAIARHLRPGGAALVPLWTPPPTPPEQMGVARVSRSGTAEARYTVLDESFDRAGRTRTTHARFELITADESRAAEREWIIHWFTDDVLDDLAAASGLEVSLTPVDDEQKSAVLRRQRT